MTEPTRHNDFHDEMMVAQSMISVALERAGFDPCPAISIAQDAAKAAWDVWNKQAAELEKYQKRLEWVLPILSLAEGPADERAMRIAGALMMGKSGIDALDEVIAMEQQR